MAKKEEGKRELHWRATDPYRVDNPETGMAYAAISEGPSLAEALSVGWEVIKASEHPGLITGAYIVDDVFRYKEKVWCHIPKNVMDERALYYADMAKHRAESQNMKAYLPSNEHIGGSVEIKNE